MHRAGSVKLEVVAVAAQAEEARSIGCAYRRRDALASLAVLIEVNDVFHRCGISWLTPGNNMRRALCAEGSKEKTNAFITSRLAMTVGHYSSRPIATRIRW